MSIEAIVWFYHDGEPAELEFQTISNILSTERSEWDPEHARLTVWFENPGDYVDIYFGEDPTPTNRLAGFMVSRPIDHPDYLKRIFQVLEMGGGMMIYTDETTPVLVRGTDTKHYPSDLLAELGEPRFVDAPEELLHQT